MYQQNLPVPADAPLEHLFLRGDAPYPPNTPAAQELTDQDRFQLHAQLITILQEHAYNRTSAVRVFMFNIYAQNQYNNQQYADMYDSAAAYFLYLAQTGNRNPIVQAADTTIKAEIPLVVQSYPDLQNMMTPQQVDDLRALWDERQRIAAEMQRYYGGGGMGMGGGMGGGFGQPTPYGQPVQMGAAYQGRGAPMGGTYPRIGTTRGSPTQVNRPPTGSSGANRMLDSSGQRTTPTPRPMGMSRRPPVGTTFDTTAKPQLKVPEATPEEKPAEEVQYKNVDWVRSFTLAHDSKHRQISRVKDGRTEYGIVPREGEGMEYRQHEDDPTMIELSRQISGGPNVQKSSNWPAVSQAVSIGTDAEVEQEKVSDLADDTPVILNDIHAAFSISQATTCALAHMHKLGLKPSSDRVYEYYVDLTRPVVASSDSMRIVDELVDTRNLTELVDRFSSMAGRIEPELWYLMHDRLTDVMNRRLHAGLGSSVGIESIADDYEDLMDLLPKKNVSMAMLDRFKISVHGHMLRSIRTTTFEDHIGNDVDLHNALCERFSVTHLPWSSKEIDLKIKGYSMLSEAVDPDMAEALLAIVHRTAKNDKTQVNRRLVTTIDNRWFELHQADVHKDTAVVSLIHLM